jgi:hypothetical protein
LKRAEEKNLLRLSLSEMFLKILPPEVNSLFLRLVVREHCEKMLAGGSDSPCLLGFMLELLQLVSLL